jgi:hypothetical protein
MTKNNMGALCPELAAILASEVAMGNGLKDGPNKADWPEPGSVFAAARVRSARRAVDFPGIRAVFDLPGSTLRLA